MVRQLKKRNSPPLHTRLQGVRSRLLQVHVQYVHKHLDRNLGQKFILQKCIRRNMTYVSIKLNIIKSHVFIRIVNEMPLVTNFLADCKALLGYSRSPHNRRNVLCNYCKYSVRNAPTMAKHIKDDHPEHLSTSTYKFI
jgi:hypothetical protein